MRWNRQRVATVAILFVTVVLTSFFVTFTADHDGETLGLGPDPTASATLDRTPEVETGDLDPGTGLPWVRREDLPVQAIAVLALIEQDGPFPEDEDGSTFQNREGLLPDRESGYYREFTVPTPGSDDRGARRIVAGARDDERFWTDDHYASFSRIVVT